MKDKIAIALKSSGNEALKELLSRGFNPSQALPEFGNNTLIHLAAYNKMLEKLAFLLEKIPASEKRQVVNQGNNCNVTPLHEAVWLPAPAERGGEEYSQKHDYKLYITNAVDKAWLKKLADTAEGAKKAFMNDDYAQALELTEARFWDFCDNYLEIVKKRAYSEDNKSAVAALMLTLDTFVKLFAPFCPFITEEIYQVRPWKTDTEISVHKEAFPASEDFSGLTGEAKLYDTVVVIASEIRKAKTAANKPLKTPVESLEIAAPADTEALLKIGQGDIENVGQVNAGGITYSPAETLEVKNIVLDMD